MTGATKASPQPLDRLYEIDTPLALCHCLTAFQTAVKDTFATLSQADEDALIAEILGGDKPIHPDLYRRYADNLRRAVKQVPVDDNLAAQWQANVSRFAAYKAYHATNDIRAAADTEHARTALHNYNRWQAAEYNTAVTRARTGRQWQQWDNPDDRRLFPNIKWIPSRSATPREEHIPFYNRIWPKDDPFWQNNQPGNLWNCKCDWQQTDEPATDGNPAADISKPGLRGNPATTGQIFSDDASYIQNSGHNRRERDAVEKACEIATHNIFKQTAKQNPLLNQSYPCEIDGKLQDIHFADWGISETAYSMYGNKNYYWLKNEVLSDPEKYFSNAQYISSADVDYSHNSGKTLRLKKKFEKYHYAKITLADGKEAYLNIVQHIDGNYYLYTISKRITTYQ